jgi:hypothetical protein
MTTGERSRINSPITAKQVVKRVMRARGASPHDEAKPRKNSQMAELKQRLLETTRQLEDAEERATAAEANQPAFDIDRTKPKDIAAVFTRPQSASVSRIKALRDELTLWLKHHSKAKGKAK